MRVKRGQDRRGRGLAGMIGSMLLMMAAILFFTLFSVQFGERTTAGDQETLKKAIARASVQCYAIEEISAKYRVSGGALRGNDQPEKIQCVL